MDSVEALVAELRGFALDMDEYGDGNFAKKLRLAADHIEAQREHIRKQAEDIMTLGALVYDDSNPPVEWKTKFEAISSENERLRQALRRNFCPRPANNRPDQFDVGDCVDADECGCMNCDALARAVLSGGQSR